MNQEIIVKYFLDIIKDGKYSSDYEIEKILEYSHSKTEFIYETTYEPLYESNGYLIYYVERQSGMGFRGKYFILAEDIRNYQLNKILNGTNNN